MTKKEVQYTALYERLSRDDDQNGDSNSIANQKSFLEKYAVQHGYTDFIHYTDDGWSGVNFERPAWKKLVEDIKTGTINRVIVKDMSRIGRNYLYVGFYTEVMFQQHGVHFIAVSNGVDSKDQNSNEFAPFLNIMNEWYLRDLSQKQRTAIRIKGESGKPTTNRAIYGYKKSPEDKNKWIIDEEAAEIVRKIFRLTICGKGPYEIARILASNNVETPSVYARKNKSQSKDEINLPVNPYNWSGFVVGQIISKPEYMGDTVNFRFRKQSYKDRNSIKVPKEEWLIFKDSHEAIVDRTTWELAQSIRKTPKRIDTFGTANPLTGILFCADCGRKMYNHRSKGNKKSKNYPSDYYDCSLYTLSNQKKMHSCRGHYITSKNLYILILDIIREFNESVCNDEEHQKQLWNLYCRHQDQKISEAKKQMTKSTCRIDELDCIIKRLYESFAKKEIVESRFCSLLSEYEDEQKVLKDSVKKIKKYLSDTKKKNQEMLRERIIKKYTEFPDLSSQTINEFIQRIEVHAPEYIDGERTQELDIYLNFSFMPLKPQKQPSRAELKRQEELRKQRIRNRKNYQEKKAKNSFDLKKNNSVCIYCGNPILSVKTNTKYCSSACRKRSNYYSHKQKLPLTNKPSVISLYKI